MPPRAASGTHQWVECPDPAPRLCRWGQSALSLLRVMDCWFGQKWCALSAHSTNVLVSTTASSTWSKSAGSARPDFM